MFSPSDSTAQDGNPKMFIKGEEASYLEVVLIKEEKEIEESECEAAIKQEPLFCDDLESVEDVKVSI